MRQLYEVDVPSEALTDSVPPTCPALWRYRTQVTLDHFSHTFQQEVLSTDTERNKVLAEFLRQVNRLKRADKHNERFHLVVNNIRAKPPQIKLGSRPAPSCFTPGKLTTFS